MSKRENVHITVTEIFFGLNYHFGLFTNQSYPLFSPKYKLVHTYCTVHAEFSVIGLVYV